MLKRDGKTRLASDATIYPDVVIEAARKEQLEYFAFLVECHQQHALVCRDLNCQANMSHCKTVIRPGKKFIKVDVGTSGKYMIEIGTWIIYGIKAYGVVHRGHSYGTLDTVDLYYWGLYVGGLMTEDLGIC
jgi:hypothetical protein